MNLKEYLYNYGEPLNEGFFSKHGELKRIIISLLITAGLAIGTANAYAQGLIEKHFPFSQNKVEYHVQDLAKDIQEVAAEKGDGENIPSQNFIVKKLSEAKNAGVKLVSDIKSNKAKKNATVHEYKFLNGLFNVDQGTKITTIKNVDSKKTIREGVSDEIVIDAITKNSIRYINDNIETDIPNEIKQQIKKEITDNFYKSFSKDFDNNEFDAKVKFKLLNVYGDFLFEVKVIKKYFGLDKLNISYRCSCQLTKYDEY